MSCSRLLVVLALLASAQGCATWVRHPVTPTRLPVLSGDGPVRVTLADSSRVELHRAHFIRDSLVGEYGKPSRRMAVAVADLTSVEERTTSSGTAMSTTASAAKVSAGVIGALFVVVLFMGLNAWK